MTGEDLWVVLIRWVHILTAVVAVGGAIFMRLVLMPSAREALTDEQHQALRAQVIGRWKRLVMICIGLLLLTGFGNFFLVGIAKGKENPLYHTIFGIKFLLALGVFFFASALTGRSKTFEGLRSNAPFWTAITAGLGVLILLLGGVLARMG